MHTPIPCEPLHEVLQYSGGHGIQDMRCRSRITELQEFRFHIICRNSLVYCNLLGETPVFSLKKHENSECGKESVAAFSYRWETAGFEKPAGRRTDVGTG